ncbi:Riboflavin synthase alpha chain [Cronobacter turicensis 564]|nr:Riboflavin synthase alpha chain [Cronobacter turicensis 564]
MCFPDPGNAPAHYIPATQAVVDTVERVLASREAAAAITAQLHPAE